MLQSILILTSTGLKCINTPSSGLFSTSWKVGMEIFQLRESILTLFLLVAILGTAVKKYDGTINQEKTKLLALFHKLDILFDVFENRDQ